MDNSIVIKKYKNSVTRKYIYVSNDEIDQNRSSYNMEVITRIEVVTRFDSDSGGELDCNLIVDECLSLLRTRSAGYFDLAA